MNKLIWLIPVLGVGFLVGIMVWSNGEEEEDVPIIIENIEPIFNGSDLIINRNISLNWSLTKEPNIISFHTESVLFEDTTINTTWCSDERLDCGFYFNFSKINRMVWNIRNETYIYEKVEETNQ